MQIILDIGVNYYEYAEEVGCDLISAAAEMIYSAAMNDIKTVKFQWYKADKLVTDKAKCYWSKDFNGIESQKQLFRKYDTFDYEQYKRLKDYCDDYGVEFMATAFDCESLEKLNPLVSRHKTASADITNYHLLSQVNGYGKPVILSTGAADFSEIMEALAVLNKVSVTLLHCVLKYPTPDNEANLGRILKLKSTFHKCKIGYSDHCIYNPDILKAAVCLGAEVIEKHFTMTPKSKGNDHFHSVSNKQLADMVQAVKYVEKVIGKSEIDQQEARTMARRGVYFKKDVNAGDVMSLDDVEFLRPQLNEMSPMEFAWKVRNGDKYIVSHKKGDQL